MAASESTTIAQSTASDEQQQPLSSRLPPVKPLEAGLPSSLLKLSSMRKYTMPSAMKLPYDTSAGCSSSSSMNFALSEASLESLMASRRSHMNRIMKQRLATEFALPPLISRQVSFRKEECSSHETHNDVTATEEGSIMPQHERPELEEGEPAPKRRRFQRRNSKTPAMLMSSLATAAHIAAAADFQDQQESHSRNKAFDGGLEIAQELVRALQLRRRKHEHAASKVDATSS